MVLNQVGYNLLRSESSLVAHFLRQQTDKWLGIFHMVLKCCGEQPSLQEFFCIFVSVYSIHLWSKAPAVWCSDLMFGPVGMLDTIAVRKHGFGRSLRPGKPSNSPRRVAFICLFVVLGPIWERRSLLQDTCLAIFYIPDAVYCLLW